MAKLSSGNSTLVSYLGRAGFETTAHPLSLPRIDSNAQGQSIDTVLTRAYCLAPMPTKRAPARIFLQVQVTTEQKRLFMKAAEIQGTDASSLTRVLLLREVDRMRAEGKKL